eukprot:30828-Pelagococcus_subviridis.AAC.35
MIEGIRVQTFDENVKRLYLRSRASVQPSKTSTGGDSCLDPLPSLVLGCLVVRFALDAVQRLLRRLLELLDLLHDVRRADAHLQSERAHLRVLHRETRRERKSEPCAESVVRSKRTNASGASGLATYLAGDGVFARER